MRHRLEPIPSSEFRAAGRSRHWIAVCGRGCLQGETEPFRAAGCGERSGRRDGSVGSFQQRVVVHYYLPRLTISKNISLGMFHKKIGHGKIQSSDTWTNSGNPTKNKNRKDGYGCRYARVLCWFDGCGNAVGVEIRRRFIRSLPLRCGARRVNSLRCPLVRSGRGEVSFRVEYSCRANGRAGWIC